MCVIGSVLDFILINKLEIAILIEYAILNMKAIEPEMMAKVIQTPAAEIKAKKNLIKRADLILWIKS